MNYEYFIANKIDYFCKVISLSQLTDSIDAKKKHYS